MIDLNSDKIDNPEDNTQENEEVENSSIKKRIIIGAGIVVLLIAGCVGGYAGYNYKQACSEHNQQVKFCIQRLAIVLLPLRLILGY